MDNKYEIAVDIDMRGDHSEYVKNMNAFNGDWIIEDGSIDCETASFCITRQAKTLYDAMMEVSGLLTDHGCAGRIVGCRDMRTEKHSLGEVEAGYLPEGYEHVSVANPYLTGNYWCLCKVGYCTPKLEFRKVYFKREHNSRWIEDSEMRVLAWTK